MIIPIQLQKDEFRFILLKDKDKSPLEVQWQNVHNYKYNDPKLLRHIQQGGNYGVIGGYGNLVIIDGDSEEVNKIAETLSETFTVKTGSPEPYKKHYYYLTDKIVKPIRLTKTKVGDLGDVRSKGQYVVGPTCIHPTGGIYKVTKDIPITKISEEQIRKTFKELINAKVSTQFGEFIPDTTKRDTPYIRYCKMPDYFRNNPHKRGGTSKNLTLFPMFVDIAYNRGLPKQFLLDICKIQGYPPGAITGWITKAKEGQLMKGSCQKMNDYMKKYYPKINKEVCNGCECNKKEENTNDKQEDIGGIKEQVFRCLLKKERNEATELLVQSFLSSNHIYTTRDDEKSEVWIYKEGIYVPQAKTHIREYCREILTSTFTTQLCNDVISKIEADTFIDQEEFFKEEDLNLIAIKEGILKIKEKTQIEFSPKYRFFNKIPISFDTTKECKEIKKFFESLFKDKKESLVIQEIFGFLLHRDYFLEKAFMFNGNGRNGKSKTLMLMKKFIGIDNCTEIPLDEFEKDNFALGELHKKSANLCGDISKTALNDTGKLKKLTGRDLISAARKFKTRIKFENYAKMIFAANEIPVTYDLTEAFFNRWIILDFPYRFLTNKEIKELKEKEKINTKLQDPYIIEKIATEEEMSGLLNWALEGLERIRKNKTFSFSPSTEETKLLWQRRSNSFNGFCLDLLKENYEGRITKAELRRVYCIYCKQKNVRQSSDKAIKNILAQTFGISEERWRCDGTQITYWNGIMFKSGKVGMDGKGFSTYREVVSFDIGLNSPTKLTTLTKQEGNKEIEVEEIVDNTNNNLKWDDRCKVNRICVWPIGNDEMCCEMPTNELNDGKCYCKQHFEEAQK